MKDGFYHTLRIFLANKALLLFVSVAAIVLLPHGTAYKINTSSALTAWAQWDGEAYLTIAERGYVSLADGRTLYNFLPLYPFTIRLLGFVVHDLALAGFVLSAAFGLAAFYYLYRLTEKEFGKDVAKKAVVLLVFFPTAFFFTALYTESMFLALAVASFYYARNGNFLYAGALAFFLPFIRIVGLLFWAVLLVEYLSLGFKTRKIKLTENELGLLIALAGVAAFFAFSLYNTGTIFGYANQQNLWTRAVSSPHVALLNALELILLRGPVLAVYSLWNLAVLAFFAGTLYYAVKNLPLSYPVYMFLVMILPLLSSTLEGFSRFILICFPSFMILALLLRNRHAYLPFVAVSIIFLVILTARFVTGAVETVIG